MAIEKGSLSVEHIVALKDLYVAASKGAIRPETLTGKKFFDRIPVDIGEEQERPSEKERDLIKEINPKMKLVRDAKECKSFMRMIERIIAANYGETLRTNY